MILAPIVASLLFVLVSLVIGTRLILLSRRAHRVQSLSIGLGFLLGGGIGFPMLFAALALSDRLGPSMSLVQASGLVCVNLSAVTLSIFTWRTFRPVAGWALVVVVAVSAVLLGSFALQAIGDGFGSPIRSGTSFWIGTVTRALVPLWAGFESIRYRGLMRRRQRLGLAEPLMVNRFSLWGAGSIATFMMAAISLAAIELGPTAEPLTMVLLRFGNAGFGFFAAATTWLAFFPPSRYRRLFATPEPAGECT